MQSRTLDGILAFCLLSMAALCVVFFISGFDQKPFRCTRDEGSITCHYHSYSALTKNTEQQVLVYGSKEFNGFSCFPHSTKNGSYCGIGISREFKGEGYFYELFSPDGTKEDFARLE